MSDPEVVSVTAEAAETAFQGTDESTAAAITVQVIGGDRTRIIKHDSSLAQATGDGAPSPFTLQLQAAGVVEPPYDPRMLNRLLEHSNSLRQNVDAYATNIDGFGHHFEPTINLEADDAQEKLRDAIILDRMLDAKGGAPIDDSKEPTDEEVLALRQTLKREMRIQRARAESFFEYACPDIAFTTLRQRTRIDQEVTGNAYWELIRNGEREPSQFVFMPCHTVRLMKKDTARVKVKQVVKKGPITFVEHEIVRTFRRYVQVVDGGKPVWFKEFGDPRVMSSRTGVFYPTPEALFAEEPEAFEANEVIHFVVHSSTSSYGIPRWIGNLISVLGSRHAEEVNFLYFENKSIPPLVITVSGGRMNKDSVGKIQSYIDNEIKGKRNFHKILILEAEAPALASAMGLNQGGRCRIDIKPLTEAHLKDALFQDYDERNMDKIGMSFRLPRLLRGDIRDFNRASAQAALEFAESQVFVPERVATDFIINRMLLPSLGITHWKFVTDGPRITDPAEVAEIVSKLSTVGILTPKDGRQITAERILYRDLARVDADWVEQPVALTIAGFPLDVLDDDVIPEARTAGGGWGGGGGKGTPPAPAPAPETTIGKVRRRLMGKARQLIRLRDIMEDAEAKEAVKAFRTAAAAEHAKKKKPVKVADEDSDEVQTIEMSAAEIEKQFGIKVA